MFFQAPLVRLAPWVSLGATVGWLWLSLTLLARPKTRVWGDLLVGFTWTWLAGSLYWGWLRWEPLFHLPIEAVGLPFAIWGLTRKQSGQEGKVGDLFYLGSLLGTAITDLYFYLVDLIPCWRQLMQAEPEQISLIFQQALVKMQTPWGLGWVALLASILLVVGLLPLGQKKAGWLAFSGAVLSTILVDSLFWVAAILA